MSHSHFRHNRHPGTDLHCPLYGLDIVELHHRVEIYLFFPQHPVDPPARRDVDVKTDQIFPGDLRKIDRLLPGQRVAWVANQDQRFLHQRDDRQLWILARIRHQPEVDHVAHHVLPNLVRMAVLHMHIYRWELFQKQLQERRQRV